MNKKAKTNPNTDNMTRVGSADGSENNDKIVIGKEWGKESDLISESKKPDTDIDFEMMESQG